MKYEGKFVEARRQLEEIDELMQNNSAKGLREANRILSRVNKTMEEVGQKYNVSTPQGVPLSPIIEAFNIGAALTGNSFPTIQELDISSRLLSKGKQFIPQKGFNSIYKSIANELATIGKLGNYYEKLTKNVNFSDKAHYYSAKIEESKYKNASSFWKKPMSVLC